MFLVSEIANFKHPIEQSKTSLATSLRGDAYFGMRVFGDTLILDKLSASRSSFITISNTTIHLGLMKTKNHQMKKKLLPLLGLIAFVLLIGKLGGCFDKPKEKRPKAKITKTKEKTPEKKKSIAKGNLTHAIKQVKDYDVSEYHNKYIIENKVKDLIRWNGIVKEGKAYQEFDSLRNDLEKRLSKLQVKELPRMRKAYAKAIEHDLWKNNVTVKVKGKNYTTIEFIGGTFANNRNIEATHKAAYNTLKTLRFKTANYKFTKYDDEYTYYTVSTLNDKEISDE